MMGRLDRRKTWKTALAGMTLAVGSHVMATPVMASEDLAPYKMIRSLQFVQDSVVLGDHSAREMQRFLLETLDQRLRTAHPSTFRDLRNVDAAFVFAMSGGNPQTLDYLAAHDVEGNFDGRLARVLRRYLGGQGVTALPALDELVHEYADGGVAPYLALVAGNVTAPVDAGKALGYFDQVRLGAPGTNLEEAALRRSLSLALQLKNYPKGMDLSARYVRRFLYSPYASQFVDMFVQLVIESDDMAEPSGWTQIVDMMDSARASEIYLRVARRALLAGKQDVARDAAARAQAVHPDEGVASAEMGKLYGNLAEISSANVLEVAKTLSEIPADALSERDRNLRDAARGVADQILMPAEGDPAAQEPSHAGKREASVSGSESGSQQTAEVSAVPAAADKPETNNSAEFTSYVEQSRSKLKQIDDLLEDAEEVRR
jgi:chemotaxis protein MotC